MDPASLALSITTLLGLVDSCFNLYSKIRKSNERDGDVQATSIRLQVEKFRLKAFQEIARDEHSADLLKDPMLRNLCKKVIELMDRDVRTIHKVLSDHEHGTAENMEIGMKQIAGRASSKLKRTWSNTAWAAHDKDRLNELVARLREHNDWLMGLVPAARRQRTDFEATSAAISSNRPSKLETVQEATVNQSPIISQGAEVKKMTLIARGSIEGLEADTQALATQQIPVRELSWIPSRWSRLTLPDASSQLTLDVASGQEKAIATYSGTSSANAQMPSSNTSARSVIVEWRDSFRSEESHAQYARRLDYLVTVLRKLSASISQSFSSGNTDGDFDMLQCIGWTTTTKEFDRIGLVFSFPQSVSPSQIPRSPPTTPDLLSLNDWMVRTRKDKSIDPPPLGLRFDIARGLVLALGNLISVGWIHKELRSHNVMFFGRLGPGSALSKPYLTGYTYARPATDFAKDVSTLTSSPEYSLYRLPMDVMTRLARVDTKSDTHAKSDSLTDDSNDNDDCDEAIPPQAQKMKQSNPVRWTSAFDIYGLGIILLEIGLWRTIHNLRGKSTSHEAFVQNELDGLVQSLSYRMGDIYCGVVKQSLSLGNWVENRAQETEFFGRFIEDLAQCRA